MSQDNIQKLTNEALVEMAGSTVIGTGSGLKAQHAQAELTRRLMNSLNNINSSNTKFSRIIIDLTILLFIVGFIQLFISIRAVSSSWTECIVLTVFVAYSIYWAIRRIKQSRQSKKLN
jgi:hypothetical protein